MLHTLHVPSDKQLDDLAALTGTITVEPATRMSHEGGVVYKRLSGDIHASVFKLVEMRGDAERVCLSGHGRTERAALADLWAKATDEDRFLTVNGDDPKTGIYGEQNYARINGVFVRLISSDYYTEILADMKARRGLAVPAV